MSNQIKNPNVKPTQFCGFTVIELLVVMGLIIILSAIMLISRQGEEERLATQRTAFELVQNIREVQGKATAAEEFDCGDGNTTNVFGIYFHQVIMPQSYILFADCNENSQKDGSDVIIREINLEKTVEVYNLEPTPAPLDIVFFPPDPITAINGHEEGVEAIITIALKSNPSLLKNQKRIKINNVGKIEIE